MLSPNRIPELKQILTLLCYSALVLMKSPCRGPTFRIKRFAWQLLTDESQRGIMHFDIGHVLWGWATQPTPNLAPASPQTNNNNMSSCLTQLLRPKIISTLKWDDTLIKMPSIFQEKTRRTIWFPSNLNPIDCISLSSIEPCGFLYLILIFKELNYVFYDLSDCFTHINHLQLWK